MTAVGHWWRSWLLPVSRSSWLIRGTRFFSTWLLHRTNTSIFRLLKASFPSKEILHCHSVFNRNLRGGGERKGTITFPMFPFSLNLFLPLLCPKREIIQSLFSLPKRYRDSPPGKTRHLKRETHASALRNLVNNQPAAHLLRITWWDKAWLWWGKRQLSCYFRKLLLTARSSRASGNRTHRTQPSFNPEFSPSVHPRPSLLPVLHPKTSKLSCGKHRAQLWWCSILQGV